MQMYVSVDIQEEAEVMPRITGYLDENPSTVKRPNGHDLQRALSFKKVALDKNVGKILKTSSDNVREEFAVKCRLDDALDNLFCHNNYKV